METNGEPAAPVEYWPQRMVSTVTEGTLAVWRKQLERRSDELHAELAKVEGGIAQLDAEAARRETARKERLKADAPR